MICVKGISMTNSLSDSDIKELEESSKKIRRNILKMVHNAKSGHPGGSLSSVDILNVLFTKVMKHYPELNKNSDYPNRDRFILSKGHASPALYAVIAHCGYFKEEELLTFRKLGSKFQGHPSSRLLQGIEVSTGSLGQGLSIACGMALGLRLDKINSKIYVYMGDGEIEEGSVWEACMNAAHNKLNNIIAFVDRNKLQIDGSTENIKSIGDVNAKFEAFGWNTTVINGHDYNQIYSALKKAQTSDKPFVIVADTIKGKGVSFMENNAGWHGKAPKKEDYERAMEELK
jgi:transketolase